jgi:ABC-type dipeptide/oligopeptide/nickel transport system permease subunit
MTFEPSLAFGVAYTVAIIVVALLIVKTSKVYDWNLDRNILRRFMKTFANALLLTAAMLIFTPASWAPAAMEIRNTTLIGMIFALFALKWMWMGEVGRRHKEEKT